MKQKVFFIQNVIFLFFFFSCNKEEILESKPEVKVYKGLISDGISVKNSSEGLDSEIGKYILISADTVNLETNKDQAARLANSVVNPFLPPTPPLPPYLPDGDYQPFIQPGNTGAWFSNTGRISRHSFVLKKSMVYVAPLSPTVPVMLAYCSFVYNGYHYQFRNYPVMKHPGVSTIGVFFSQYTVEAFRVSNVGSQTPDYEYTNPHYSGSGNYIAGGWGCVRNCIFEPGGSNNSTWQTGIVNVTSMGYLDSKDVFTFSGTLTVQGVTVPFDLHQYGRAH
ncbi:hypothetical protein [Dyadobacter sp. LHD-138]|uniref:hypothetical protein n=1 Tax=Dyadobacter sp. LHD-138 TaxID=3071413 RepID=UPI0027DF0191|nr:hypothetical protein [Dyadobacter sp. LHD-138]MDQ6478766.1 hypothetical protein [Dyadobacter sp. LHD-138]